MPEDNMTFASALSQTESLRNDIRHSKQGTLIALLVSSFLLYYWFNSMYEAIYKGGYMPVSRWLLMYPAIFNSVAWFFWFFSIYVYGIRSLRHKHTHRLPEERLAVSYLVEQYHATLNQHSQQRKIHMVVEITIAIQLAVMGVSVAYYLASPPRLMP